MDSNDRERITEAKDELDRMLNEDELRSAILLVFANKQVCENKCQFCLVNIFWKPFTWISRESSCMLIPMLENQP